MPIDGLILGGGADVAPDRYAPAAPEEEAPSVREELTGRTPRGKVRALAGYVVSPAVYLLRRALSVRLGGLDQPRDALEIALLERADREGAPVLGICRGAQLMNVYCGGTLHRDLSTFYVESPHPWTVFPRKAVSIVPGSTLARALGRTRCRVNSLHRQAVDALGRGLVATAREDSGVVQAVEDPSRPFFVGVQWHPEYLPQRPEQRRLLRALVSAARGVGVGIDEELLADLSVSQEHRHREDQPQHG